MKKNISMIILLAIIGYLVYLKGINKCETNNISKEAEKQIEIKEKIIYVKQKQSKSLQEPSDVAARKSWIKLFKQERASDNKQ